MKLNPSEDLDYNILEEGIYLYKINDDITTYDIRMKAPNKEQVLTNSAIHTLEHIINTYLKTVEQHYFLWTYGKQNRILSSHKEFER